MVRFFPENEQLRCAFVGSLNTIKCLELEKELYARVSETKLPVVFDMKDVDFIASVFLRICLTVFKDVGDRLSIINLQPAVMTVFKIAGFTDLIKGIA